MEATGESTQIAASLTPETDGMALPPPRGLRRGSLPPELRQQITPLATPTGQLTPSKVAQRMLKGLVMTPPRTPPPNSARSVTGGGGDKFFPGNDRIRALREEGGPLARSNLSPKPDITSSPTCEAVERPKIKLDAPVEVPGTGPEHHEESDRENHATAAKPAPAVTAAVEPGLPPMHGPVEHEGWLYKLKPKLGGDGVGKWHKRWFQLRDGFLLYFKGPDVTAETPAGWLRLAQITSVTDIPTDTQIPGAALTPAFTFRIQLTTRVLYVHGKTGADVKGWKDRLSPKPLAPVVARPRLTLDPSASPPPTFQQSPLGKSRSIQKKISSGLREATSIPLDFPETIGEGKEPETGDEIPIPEDAVWIKCYDPDTASYYYIKAATGESVWAIPQTEVDYMSEHWVKCFDYENNAVFFSHAATGDERYTPVDPRVEGATVGGTIPDPESGLVWVEAWDPSYNLPYYVKFDTGDSQWEWPTDPGAHVVQYGSEDYNWYWKWLNQTVDDGDSVIEKKYSEKNLFGSCFS